MLIPKMCTFDYRWIEDDLICTDCGQKIGCKHLYYNDQDEPEIRVNLFYPYIKYIDKENIK